MKKIFAIIMCALIMCALPVVAFAEEEIPDATVEDVTGEETPPVETTPETSPEPTPEEQAKTVADMIVAWVLERLETISCIVTIFLTTIYQIRKHAVLNKSVATLNNNSIAMTENSNAAIQHALMGVEDVSTTVANYHNEMAVLLAEVRQNAEEKKRLESALLGVESYLKTAKLANVELADEVAELLVLANIPNSKKEELYSRHRAAVDAINAVEFPTENTEVKADVEKEA